MKWNLVFALAFGCSGPLMLAQGPTINPTDVFVVQSEWHRPLIMPVRCNSDQNVYVRGYETGNAKTPIIRVSARGDKVKPLSPDSEPAFDQGAIQDFALSPDGNVYELWQVGNDLYVAGFSSDGSYSSKTKLSKQFAGSKIAALPRGDAFLISGWELPVKGGPPPKLYSGLFDGNGNLIRQLSFAKDAAEIKEDRVKGVGAKNYLVSEGALPLILGDAEVDQNGFLYVMRASASPQVFISDSTGKLVRKLTVQPPKPGMTVGAMHLSAGRIALLFQTKDEEGQITERRMTITDAVTGEKIGDYSLSNSLGSAFACYADNDFIFITTKQGKLAIQHSKVE